MLLGSTAFASVWSLLYPEQAERARTVLLVLSNPWGFVGGLGGFAASSIVRVVAQHNRGKPTTLDQDAWIRRGAQIGTILGLAHGLHRYCQAHEARGVVIQIEPAYPSRRSREELGPGRSVVLSGLHTPDRHTLVEHIQRCPSANVYLPLSVSHHNVQLIANATGRAIWLSPSASWDELKFPRELPDVWLPSYASPWLHLYPNILCLAASLLS